MDVVKDFSDPEVAFGRLSLDDLRKSYFLFKTLNSPRLVKFAPQIVDLSLKLHLPIKPIIKATMFGHFCGGESIEECNQLIENLSLTNVGVILDYATEGCTSEVDYDQVVSEVLKTIQLAKRNDSIPFTVFKPSGIVDTGLLSKKAKSYTSREVEQYQKFKDRFSLICQEAYNCGVRVMIDAEESWIQDEVDQLAEQMMSKFNQEKTIVFNTVQLYRKGRLDYIRNQITRAKNSGYKIGFKLVRGAYLEKESERAISLGYDNPLHEKKFDCDKDYNEAVSICLDNIQTTAIVAGTHNMHSVELLLNEMKKRFISVGDDRIVFAQLLGMSDYLTNALSRKGYNVCKYVPYGPVSKLLPYLTRRAQENSSIAGQSSRELAMIQAEIRRRKALEQ